MQYKDAFLMPIDRKGIHFPPFQFNKVFKSYVFVIHISWIICISFLQIAMHTQRLRHPEQKLIHLVMSKCLKNVEMRKSVFDFIPF